MATVNHQNFFATTLTSNVNAGDTTTPLNSIPSIAAPFYLTFDATNVNGHAEVVLVTSKTTTNVNHAALQYAHTTSEVVKHAIVAEEINELYNAANGGWQGVTGTYAYASSDGPTQVITVPAGAASIYSPGMRLKYTQSQALTSYWTLDSSSSDSVGSNNGTDTNITYTSGKFGNAATFNGTSSKIVIADNASLKPTGEFTFGCWFKTGTTGVYQEIFQSESANTNQAGIKLEIQNNNIAQFFVGKNTGTTAGVDYSVFNGITNVCDNVWHYVVISFRNNYLQMYIDGKLESSGYSFSPAYAATNYVRVGCRNGTGSDSLFFNGQIDDLFLINGYALDEATIKAKYAAATAQGTGNITVQKYALITAVTDTTLTVYSGTDYSVQNATISSPYYSTVAKPFGFNGAEEKWTVEISSTATATQSSPTSGTWYNPGSASISVPIGSWNLGYDVNAYGIRPSGSLSQKVSLSTANNTESDSRYTKWIFGVTLTELMSGLSTYLPKSTIAKTTYYLVSSANQTGMSSISYQNGYLIRAISTYL